jgi:hypothetical protein
MKIYFSASLRGTQYFEHYYELIYNEIIALGHTHVDTQLFTNNRKTYYLKLQKAGHIAQVAQYQKKLDAIHSADACIFDMSFESSSIGYQLARALDLHKPTIILYCEENFPYFFGGIYDERLIIKHYSEATVKKVLKSSIEYVHQKKDQRFNFFVTPDLLSHLDETAKKLKTTKSDYLRHLIESDRKRAK